MAAYFQLISKATGKATPFNQIDEELCAHFDQPVNDEQYLAGWYNSIGCRTATGRTIDEIRAEFQSYIDKGDHPEHYKVLLEILSFLEEHYTTSSWYSRY